MHWPFEHKKPSLQWKLTEHSSLMGIQIPLIHLEPTEHKMTWHISTQTSILQNYPLGQGLVGLHTLFVMHYPLRHVVPNGQIVKEHLSTQLLLRQVNPIGHKTVSEHWTEREPSQSPLTQICPAGQSTNEHESVKHSPRKHLVPTRQLVTIHLSTHWLFEQKNPEAHWESRRQSVWSEGIA